MDRTKNVVPPPREAGFHLPIPMKKSVSPFNEELPFGWLGTVKRSYPHHALGCVFIEDGWTPIGKDDNYVYIIYFRSFAARNRPLRGRPTSFGFTFVVFVKSKMPGKVDLTAKSAVLGRFFRE